MKDIFEYTGYRQYIADYYAEKKEKTFWHQMNFGDEERNMQAYYDEIPLDEMVDIAGYAQTLP